MNLFVTGGAGFIGSHFVLRHVEQYPDDRVVVLDKLTYAADQSFLEPVASRITFVQGDIADRALVEKLVKEHSIDTIINFAAETHVDNSISDASPFLQTNILGVVALLEVCRATGARFYHISTDEVYGDLGDDDPSHTTGDVLTPSSPYSASKASAEMMVMAWMRTYGVKACVSRCTNNYGPHQAAEKFLPTMIRCALQDKPLPLYGKGENKRDWLHVHDHCDAIETILHTDWAFWDPAVPGVHSSQSSGSGHFFNISADAEKRNIDVAKKVLEILGKPESLISFVKDRPGHDWRYAVDSSATRSLGWQPRVSFEEGLRKTVEWYRQLQK